MAAPFHPCFAQSTNEDGPGVGLFSVGEAYPEGTEAARSYLLAILPVTEQQVLEGRTGWHTSMPTTKKEMNYNTWNKSNGVERRGWILQILYFVGGG